MILAVEMPLVEIQKNKKLIPTLKKLSTWSILMDMKRQHLRKLVFWPTTKGT